MKRKYFLPLFLLFQIIALKIIVFFPEFVEHFYSNGIYIWISSFFRITLGILSFSIGDILYLLIIFWVIKWFYNSRNKWKENWKSNLLQIINFISIFYFFFHLLWGMNYYRVPLFEKMNIERDYTDSDLLQFTQKLIAKTNQLQSQLAKNDSLKVRFPYTQKQVFEMNLNGYQNLSKEYSFFHYKYPSIKKSMISLPLTYMGFGGYLNPFTNEAQVNYLGPLYSFPMTTNHEMAHQLGFASESECNFIGFLASVNNDNLYIQYSGYSNALRYCLGNWSIRNDKIFKELLKTIHPGILANYQESEDFWKQYDTIIDKGFHAFYDQFLKINHQKEGLDSYSKFIDLLVNYHKTREL